MPEEIDRIKEVYHQRSNKPQNDYNPLLPENYYILSSREKALVKCLNKYFGLKINHLNILDVGFGSGLDLLSLIRYGINIKTLNGTEILPERFNKVRELLPGANLVLTDGFYLPFADSCMDLLLQSTVFSSVIDPDSRLILAQEMYRVLKPGGKIFSYDLKIPNPWNKNVVEINRKELKRLFPEGKITCSSVTLNPVLARKIAPFSLNLCEFLSHFSLLCSHYYAVIEK
jgi:ubiquinone/menaquinone biosynthesis C-methylase UbiE